MIKDKEKLKTIVLVIFLIIGWIILLSLSYIYFKNKFYNQGVADGQNFVYLKVIDELQRHGYTTISITQDNQTSIIKLGVIE